MFLMFIAEIAERAQHGFELSLNKPTNQQKLTKQQKRQVEKAFTIWLKWDSNAYWIHGKLEMESHSAAILILQLSFGKS